MLKASGDLGILRLTNVIKQVWQTRVIPPDWKKGIILPIYNGKGSPKDWAYHSYQHLGRYLLRFC